jgi:hypothetical protein
MLPGLLPVLAVVGQQSQVNKPALLLNWIIEQYSPDDYLGLTPVLDSRIEQLED